MHDLCFNRHVRLIGTAEADETMTQSFRKPSRRRDISLGAFAVGVVAIASIAGQFATYPNLIPWFAGLKKPSFNPPNWVFGPVWTALYVIMAFALWRILRITESSAAHRLALFLFFIQLTLNAAWSWMFFAAQSPFLGMINIIPQLAFVIVTIAAFYPLDRIAAWCLVPLAAWVSFASILNLAIWRLNG